MYYIKSFKSIRIQLQCLLQARRIVGRRLLLGPLKLSRLVLLYHRLFALDVRTLVEKAEDETNIQEVSISPLSFLHLTMVVVRKFHAL